MTWIQLLRILLCRLYEAWGGNCQDLNIQPDKAVQQLVEEYTNSGAPVFEDPEDLADFLKLLDDIETHLASNDNSLDQETNKALLGLVSDLRNDLGGV